MKRRRRLTLEEVRAQARAFCSGQVPIVEAPKVRRTPRKIEAAQGMALTKWANTCAQVRPELEHLRHIPNGGARDARTGKQLKDEGVRPGTWDYVLPVVTHERGMLTGDELPMIRWPGLWIELKAASERTHKHGGLSPAQLTFGRFIAAQGYAAVVAYDWTEARDAIEAYLDGAAVIPFLWREGVA